MRFTINAQGHACSVSNGIVFANTAWDGSARHQCRLPGILNQDGTVEIDGCCLSGIASATGLRLGHCGQPGYLWAGGVITLWPVEAVQVCDTCKRRINAVYDAALARGLSDDLRDMALEGRIGCSV